MDILTSSFCLSSHDEQTLPLFPSSFSRDVGDKRAVQCLRAASLQTTSLLNSVHLQPRSLDFCNTFLGLGNGVVDVHFAPMQGAARTVEELKNFWKERAAIEEDYAKRLTKLSKMVLGRGEIGELRNSLNAIKVETERQSGIHLNLAQQIRSDLESPAAVFYTR
ncbi:uncharacterized protein LACBIDRAFT_296194 [Laccaria bicolor S238N-H82]|uniref:Predicted protein n=1 Tax=Laccaria bicolor (strain S238N-H82 / ATCC MYA-4686) TaxID=486041 RepID=B0D870_LACBS|nr:uncharacterized protein LACBIDRAFT_296194 [Laccaria bicolor S238N-H82]EDR08783.1 predicted protein [Laccaria bicolor S238N-H82]|eukprot:XP_001880096.1 predicted protein [Laccaria bicolor S238N-H82]